MSQFNNKSDCPGSDLYFDARKRSFQNDWKAKTVLRIQIKYSVTAAAVSFGFPIQWQSETWIRFEEMLLNPSILKSVIVW